MAIFFIGYFFLIFFLLIIIIVIIIVIIIPASKVGNGVILPRAIVIGNHCNYHLQI